MSFSVSARRIAGVAVALTCIASAFATTPDPGANPPSIEEFAARPLVESAAISPDGRYLALIQTRDGRGFVAVVDRTAPGSTKKAVLAEPEHFVISWCRWATNTRLLCSLRAMVKEQFVYGISRLVAVDFDGKHLQVLVQNSRDAQGQFQDRIVSWNPGPPDTVLIEADEGLSAEQQSHNAIVYGNVGTHALPAVFELNVNTGRMMLRQHAREPIRHWIADNHGKVRIGYGFAGTTVSYIARNGDEEWRRLEKFEVFSHDKHFDPIALSPDDPNKAYAYGPYEGRRALWLIDLTDKEDPTPVFVHPSVDVGSSLIADDGRLLGVRYDTGYPLIYWVDDHARSVVEAIQAINPGKFNTIAGATRDEKLYLIRSDSDLEPSSYLLLDTGTHTAKRLGTAYPGRDMSALAPLHTASYPARDGTPITGYLSTPPGAAAKNLPLIVMPHGGPIGRDYWGYFFLREYLVSRGYAVLQMNFRGSGGFGEDWYWAAHQDWGGVTYNDVVDGARWAIAQGIADPARVCIVGWSFGGYVALLGAQRNADLFHCAVDIAGPSDLSLLINESSRFAFGSKSVERQIGTDPEKLKQDSPRRHAAEFNVPLLILQGTLDAQVQYEQSADMDAALTRANKPHRFVKVEEADHQFSGEQQRGILLHEIDAFLAEHLPVATPAAAAK
jgi:dipeptidyl aminopeptidase/acylaminoacyl peptidase